MEKKVFGRPSLMSENYTHYCPGCAHGIIHRLVAEALEELGVADRTIGVSPVGCAVLAQNYFTCDFQQAAHGRAPAVATGIKRVHPQAVVFSYQGDGDLQKTTTSPYGRDVKTAGFPIRVSEMLATLDGAKYIARVSVDTPANMAKAKEAIKRAFKCQIDGIGYSLVEVLSTCPTNWGLTPIASFDWLQKNMIPYYPLGVYKDYEEAAK